MPIGEGAQYTMWPCEEAGLEGSRRAGENMGDSLCHPLFSFPLENMGEAE